MIYLEKWYSYTGSPHIFQFLKNHVSGFAQQTTLVLKAYFKMADVLEVDVDKAEFLDDEGEGNYKSQSFHQKLQVKLIVFVLDDIQRVKQSAKKRKGRGFTG